MSGIISYGAYVPYTRLSRADIGKAWNAGGQAGERAVANYDEDSLTMAVAAALNCVAGIDPQGIDGLYFASTSAPHLEKQSSATIATLLGLRQDAQTMDFGGSLRSGTNALRAAMDAVDSGRARSVLVCAAEVRLGYPSGPFESSFGDGAGAVLVGKSDTIAEFDLVQTFFDEIQDIWRTDRDRFVRSAEDRFIMDMGYSRIMIETVKSALKSAGLTPENIQKVALAAPNQRQLKALAKKLGYDEEKQVQDILHQSVGNTGSAMALMSLIALLEQAGPDEKMLMAAYGNGCDVFTLTTSAAISVYNPKSSIRQQIASKKMLSNYNQYMSWRELVQLQPPARPPIELRKPSPIAQWRERSWEMRLCGTRCGHCGTPQYPPQRVCMICHTKDQFEPYTFFDKQGKVASFSHDYVMQTADPPVTITVVDFDGGGRVMCDMTDREPDQVHVGMPVEMTFRRLYYVDGIYNYWWKCRPPRG